MYGRYYKKRELKHYHKIQSIFAGGSSNIGTIYNKSSWGDLSDFAITGSTASIVGNSISVSGGANDYLKYLQLSRITLLEKWVMKINFQPQDLSATSFGIGIGIRSINAWGYKYSNACYVDLSTGSFKGKTVIITSVNGTLFNNYGIASTSVPFSALDNLQLILERNKNLYTCTFNNLTTGGTFVNTYTIAPTGVVPLANSGKFTIWTKGGTQYISSVNIESSELKGRKILCFGDSKTRLNTSLITESFPALLELNYGETVNASCGPSDRTVELVNTDILNEIILLRPSNVILNVGRNDLNSSVPTATWKANYSTIYTTLTNAGLKVLHLMPIAESVQDQTALTTWITANFAADTLINTSGVSISADNVHPDAAGHSTISSQIVASGLII